MSEIHIVGLATGVGFALLFVVVIWFALWLLGEGEE